MALKGVEGRVLSVGLEDFRGSLWALAFWAFVLSSTGGGSPTCGSSLGAPKSILIKKGP